MERGHQPIVTLSGADGRHVDLVRGVAGWYWGPYASGDGFAYGPFPNLTAAAMAVAETLGLPQPEFGPPPILLIVPLSPSTTAFTSAGIGGPALKVTENSGAVALSLRGEADLRRLNECLDVALALS